MAKEKVEIPAPATNPHERYHKRSWRLYAATVVSACCLVFLVHPRRPPPPLPADKAEEVFMTVPNFESAIYASRAYATHPHLAGATEDFEDAKSILKLFQDELGIHAPHHHEPIFPAGSHQSRHSTLGLTSPFRSRRPTAWIDTYYPVLNTPLNHTLQLLDKDRNVLLDANLEEDGDSLDPEAAKYKDAVPAWHGLSFDGEATGQLVYANYGTQEDFAELTDKGVNLTGKIVIARYGRIFRGLKVKGAEELGAAGVLIYSDPRDDGLVTTDNGYASYPHGPARNPTSVQRGSVQYISLYPGDPTTPGYPSYKDAERQEGINIPKIPSLPISWDTAKQFLEGLKDGSDTGAYPQLDGRISENLVKMVNHVDNKVTPIWNTMAAIPGHIKDEVVVLGCHRDAWVMGAGDPISGTVSLHEIVRGLGTLLKAGWRPLRTILIASWDGEEYGLVGSTEWGEDFHHWISNHVVSYLNVDVSVSGSRWSAQGSPSLADLIKRTALDVPHPLEPGKTLWDARHDNGPYNGNSTGSRGVPDKIVPYEDNYVEAPASEVGALGSGSDYTVFLQRIGIASTDQGFGPTEGDAVYHYHSIYDSERWQEVYGDPTFSRHVAVAKHLGLLTLRLTDSIILPLNTTRYAFELDSYLDRVENLLASAEMPQSDKPEFSDLREAIKTLQGASLKLDDEKKEAEEKFRELLDKLPRKPPHGPPPHGPPPHGPPPHEPPPHGPPPHGEPPRGPHHHEFNHHQGRRHAHCHGRNRIFGRIKRAFYYAKNMLRSLVGLPPIHPGQAHHRRMPQTPQEHLAFALEHADAFGAHPGPEEPEHPHHEHPHPPPPGHHSPPGGPPPPPPPPGHPPPPPPHGPPPGKRPHFPIRKFIKAAQRVARANKKLRSFESGFISEEGIKDREWYKHLGVAPGKWLGYGATTFPALTEAITIEKNGTLIKYEAERLQKLIGALAKAIEV